MPVGSANSRALLWSNELLDLRKYLVLLAILVATVTYVAGLNPPGGVWLDTQDGHLTGNQILVVTYHARYNAFSYSNATAFMASAVAILLLVLVVKEKDNKGPLFVVLWLVMILDLLALVVAYAAGASRDMLTTVLASLLVAPILIYVLLLTNYLASRSSRSLSHQHDEDSLGRGKCAEGKRKRKILMLLAIFVAILTYTAGLNPPGGFWPVNQDGHRAGDPILQAHHRWRFIAFFICNTYSFVASLSIIMVLVIRTFNGSFLSGYAAYEVIGSILMAIALMGAYVAGSCRETNSSTYVGVLCLAGLAIVLLLAYLAGVQLQGSNGGGIVLTPTKEKTGGDSGLNSARSLVLLLATLAATVTYQGGLNPPGGFWPDDRDGHKGGDPILLTKHATRYRVFFYCNSTALAASLAVIFMVQRDYLSKSVYGHLASRTLEAVMVLDLIGLIGAFAAGCCRDASTSIYVVALAGGVLFYVVFHIVFFTLHHRKDDLHKGGVAVENKRKLLLLIAILAVTLTYQAGLTPPGGFWLGDGDGDELSHHHHAGDPVLLSNYPRRYTAFFYLNATGFMASVALTILLVNRNLYRAGINCYALHMCMVAALFGLMGAYAAGSSRHVRTSIYMIALIALVLTFILSLLLLFIILTKWRRGPGKNWEKKDHPCFFSILECINAADIEQGPQEANNNNGSSKSPHTTDGGNAANEHKSQQANNNNNNNGSSQSPHNTGGGDDTSNTPPIQLHTRRRYLTLLGILAASVTYQAGLAPPGGVWPDNSDGHAVGNPILRDSNLRRYHIFFYFNSISFVASMVVITLQLLVKFTEKANEPGTDERKQVKFLIQAADYTMAVNLVGLLVAYAAGSSREWETFGYTVALVAAVLLYIGIHLFVAFLHQKGWLWFKAASQDGKESTSDATCPAPA